MEKQSQKLFGIRKHKTLTWLGTSFFLCLVIGILSSCSSEEDSPLSDEELPQEEIAFPQSKNAVQIDAKTIAGNTQGTTFIIKTSEDSLRVNALEIDSLLAKFDSELSGYISNSILSEFNRADDYLVLQDDAFFRTCYHISMDVYERTEGLFDPSVFPLVKAWGFFKSLDNPPTKSDVDSILQFTGFAKGKHHVFLNDTLKKLHPSFELDFNAIAQGQSADEIARFLRRRGHENYFIEVGGELVVKGINNDGIPWVIAIDLPNVDNEGDIRVAENYIHISEGGVATSGNYRKFYEKDGRKYSHTLHPLTGYPVEHNLLSATVIAPNAAIADAYATAFMVMGVDDAMQFVEKNKDLNLAVYLLYENDQGRIARASNQLMQKYLKSDFN